MPAATFPPGFLFGVAAASYQVEGAAAEGGRGPSIWDAFCAQPGRVHRGQDGSVACDQYHRYEEDAQLIADLGVSAYRLSVSWSRVLPTGEGEVNEEGVAYYDRLVDALLARGVEPWITLFHWDLPLALQHRGGWVNREVVGWFRGYTRVVADRLSDRVSNWFTLNEPACFVGLGHHTGMHAPGLRLPLAEVLRVQHHSNLAHGAAVDVLREHAKTPARVGAAPTGKACFPATDDPADAGAAARATFEVAEGKGMFFNHALSGDPMVLGRYPADLLTRFGDRMPAGFEDDLAAIQRPLDFYGINIYNGQPTRADASGRAVRQPASAGPPTTNIGWPIEPACIYWAAKQFHERYGLPMHITENGLASMDWVHADGVVHDPGRIDYTARHLWFLRKAVGEGVPVVGYFHWSVMDNFEWAEGYSKRFGLIYVDYETQERIPKDSYRWYREVVRSRGASLPDTLAPLR
ncbi:GH1 family beta-glucosidase [Phycisphaera mikurensis]|uniref:Beta-glucosidase n=1 Tax=Phycisphaera mikurensis (strain NBRC 102666 / KCTC 22515 / FYK2301M01) TaxID=1142394 RepID=I0IGW5_PHYMF|nr:GH1 family beta-glucosidase [Phycisphaera mikurensis]MBB6440760.1 beta-glucosidase [Phycisphaera mikurensis]BAM04503.1 beta-glucosidase [Phycisphaera mikurensis NBRC 102666]